MRGLRGGEGGSAGGGGRGGRTLGVLVAQGLLAHVGKLDGALGRRVREEVALERVELGRRDDLGQLLHVDRLDVEDVCGRAQLDVSAPLSTKRANETKGDAGRTERLVRDVEVPEVDAQVVGAHVRLAVRVDRDRVDVVRVRVGVHLARHGGDDRVVVRHARQAQVRRAVRVEAVAVLVAAARAAERRRKARDGGTARWRRRRRVAPCGRRAVVLGDDLERLLKHLPQLDRLVCGRGVRDVSPCVPRRRTRGGGGTHRWSTGGSGRRSGACTTGSC